LALDIPYHLAVRDLRVPIFCLELIAGVVGVPLVTQRLLDIFAVILEELAHVLRESIINGPQWELIVHESHRSPQSC